MEEHKVIVMCGVVGSGKSYFIKDYIEKHKPSSYVVCSADHYFERSGEYMFNPRELSFAHNACWEKFVEALRSDIPLIFVDNTNIVKEHRSRYINKALDNGYKVEVKVLPVDVDLSDKRNVHKVPRATIEKMAAQLDIQPGHYTAALNNRNSYDLKQQLENDEFIKKV